MAFPGRAPLLPGLPLMVAPTGAPGYHHHPSLPAMPAMPGLPLMATPVMFAAQPPLPAAAALINTTPPIVSAAPTVGIVAAKTTARSVNNATQQQYTFSRRTREPAGPPVTVFIGNITERAPDGMMRLIINSCGTVHNWKRVQGASGRLQAFGFCEFGNPDAALRCIRLLHNLEMSDKRLVARVDSKSQTVLDNFKKAKRDELARSSSGVNASSNTSSTDTASATTTAANVEADETDDYINADMKADDSAALQRIKQLLDDYAQEMANYVPRNKPKETRRRGDDEADGDSRAQKKLMELSNTSLSSMHTRANLDEMEDVEEEKKDLISREIGLFRDKMKRQEEEKERSRRRRDRSYSPSGGPPAPPPPAASASSSHSRRHHRDRSRSPLSPAGAGSISPPPPPPSHSSGRHNGSGESRHTKSSRYYRDDTERSSRSGSHVRKSDADLLREREEDEEARERKKRERKAKEKEAAYQERLRSWESRENKRRKELTKERERELVREQDVMREATKLKEFLEDYDDEKDDLKYYKGRELQRRLAARAIEGEQDARDLQKEKEELEALRARVQEEGHKNPALEFERLRREREAQYKPRLLVQPECRPCGGSSDDDDGDGSVSLARSVAAAPTAPSHSPPHTAVATASVSTHASTALTDPAKTDRAGECNALSAASAAAANVVQLDASPSSDRDGGSPCVSYSGGGDGDISPCDSGSVSRDAACLSVSPAAVRQHTPTAAVVGAADTAPAGGDKPPAKKKLNVRDVFNTDDDDEADAQKRRKLVPLDNDGDGKRKEEKKRLVKKLIEKIPTGKTELFNYAIDWDTVDNSLMERRIRPWISKKISEYIGEPEPTLVEFICSKVLVGSTAQSILDDVQMVLDEEADVFVVKMWRLLIYEIEAKKHGLCK